MNTPEKQVIFDSLKQKLVNLRQSPLYAFRQENSYQPVIGEGNLCAKVMFIGEAPGKKEAETGRPFVGAAGKMLDKLLLSISLDRQDVYITSIVQDRPPDNRDPKPEELALYAPILQALIDLIEPRVIVTLGRFSMRYVLEKYKAEEKDDPINALHGKVISVTAAFGPLTIVPQYHPAFALYNGSKRSILEADFRKIIPFL